MEFNSGDILVAEPFMGDPNFERSVILLCQHSKEGSFGLILNQPTNLVLSDIWEDSESNLAVGIGGPVEKNMLHFLHTKGSLIPNSISLGRGVFWGGDFNTAIQLLKSGELLEKDLRIFVGYSGWGPGQLEKEFKKDSWIPAFTDVSNIFESSSKELWRQVLRSMGGNYKVMSNYPTDPRLN